MAVPVIGPMSTPLIITAFATVADILVAAAPITVVLPTVAVTPVKPDAALMAAAFAMALPSALRKDTPSDTLAPI